MQVLSLFDGMSCGQIALNRLGIKVDKYYASEIDKWAIKITQKNYPNTIQVGDITKLNPNDFKDVDLIMAGSPCQGFSFAGKQLAFDDPRSALFFEFIRLLKAIKPKYFLLKNVRMKKEYLEVITDQVSQCYPDQGNDLFNTRIEPILINSALVSAQSRQRYYWTNIPGIDQPEDKGIVLRDILEDDFSSDREKSYCIDANYNRGTNPYRYINKCRQQIVIKPKQVGVAVDLNGHDILKRVYSPEGKSPTLNSMGGGNREPKIITGGAIRGRYTEDGIKQHLELRKDDKSNSLTTVQKDTIISNNYNWRKLTPLECERLQTVPDNYTEGVSNTQRYRMLGNGWTVDVICHILKNIK